MRETPRWVRTSEEGTCTVRGPVEGRQHWPRVDFRLTAMTLIPVMLVRSFQIYSELCLMLAA